MCSFADVAEDGNLATNFGAPDRYRQGRRDPRRLVPASSMRYARRANR